MGSSGPITAVWSESARLDASANVPGKPCEGDKCHEQQELRPLRGVAQEDLGVLHEQHPACGGEGQRPHERLEEPCVYESRPEGQVWHFEPCVDIVERLGSHAYHVYCTPFLPCGDVAPLGVPQGQVFVLGDHRDHSVDSRVYGPIPAQAIVGRASYIYFSLGPSGIRWNRIGRAVR